MRMLLVMSALVLASACRGGDPTATPSASPTPSARAKVLASAGPKSVVTASPKAIPLGDVTAVSPTQPPAPARTPLPRTLPPTGNAAADAAVAAIEARDVDALVALMTYEPQPCAAVAGPGGNVLCPAGTTAGTPIEIVTVSTCEGTYRRRDEVQQVLRGWLDSVAQVYGAYSLAGPPHGRTGLLVIVELRLPGASPWGGHLLIPSQAARSTWLHLGCVRSAEESSAWIAGFGTLEPLGTVLP